MKNSGRQEKECLRCGWRWFPRKKNDIRICPRCKSAYWDTYATDTIKKKKVL